MALKDAIKHLQTELGVQPVDGLFGPRTEAALKRALKAKSPGAPTVPVTGGLNERSLKNLAQCDDRLMRIAVEARKHFDFTVICGHRGEKEQNEAVRNKTSKLKWPKSKHNKKPSLAFDAVPNPVDWENLAAFKAMRAALKAAAEKEGIPVRFISWDWPHIELA